MILESCTDYFIVSELLVVVPLDGLASSGRVVDDMCAVELVEPSWCHGIRVVFDSGQVHKVDAFVGQVIVESDFV